MEKMNQWHYLVNFKKFLILINFLIIIFMFFFLKAKTNHVNQLGNNYYAESYDGGILCAKDSPWEKNGGGAEYFFIREHYDNFLICALWCGTKDDIARFEKGLAFQTQKEAEQKLGKKFENHVIAGNYMQEIGQKRKTI